ncbi:N-acetyltransferase [Nodosilinea sp. LEGE 06152]|uniref:GNAT family N-acetyltransferase n=1 Tax=Nodosilinea sp. LEGE 06152 TaxID=2777966 RepID=UPI00188044F2|nr:N-acetyltransferase [Nodosilinea sp. LEGE 06152]MBE9159251.1 N-acetyltransferase [Nodosilinea sp. LEGE 06152]
MTIRLEQPEDQAAVYQVNAIAFGRDHEAELVARLRGLPQTLSLVAVEGDAIVGHIFFSPVTLEGVDADRQLFLGLGPIAVLPDHQRQGIGTQLTLQGVEQCRQRGAKSVVVLGNPQFYIRFGFIPAAEKGLRCEYRVPEGAFQVLELAPGALEHCWGLVQYRPEFADCE